MQWHKRASVFLGLCLCAGRLVYAAAPAAVPEEFSREELRAGHPAETGLATYHTLEHSLTVWKMARDLAQGRGLGIEETRFVAQVALLHDWDPARRPGTPARVPETLRALEDDFSARRPLLEGTKGQSVLKERFGWSEEQFKMAKAMIQRTEFPFAEQHPNPHYQTLSPVGQYEVQLAALSPKARRFVLREGALLSEYADKASFYATLPFHQALRTVGGLANEINAAAGREVVTAASLDTAGFLASIGRRKSFEHDYALARKFGIAKPGILTHERAFSYLPRAYRRSFVANVKHFQRMNRATRR